MEALGDPTLKPFLQDVIQLKPLVQTLAKQASAAPPFLACCPFVCAARCRAGMPLVQALAQQARAWPAGTACRRCAAAAAVAMHGSPRWPTGVCAPLLPLLSPPLLCRC